MNEEIDFKKINFGPDDAKEDIGLLKYFVEIPGYKELLQGNKRYIIGSKGSGKTAIIEYLRLSSISDPLVFTSSISLRDFPLNYIRDLRDKSLRDKSQFVSVWIHLLIISLAKMVSSDYGIKQNEWSEILNKFIEKNSGINSTITQSIKYLKDNSSKVTIGGSWLGHTHTSRSSTEEYIEVNYRKVNDFLINSLRNIESNSTYYIFLDELDEGFKAGDKNLRLLLLALLRAVEDLSLKLRSSTCNFRPILVLRSDIFDSLEDNDLNKLDDYIIRLRWVTNKKSLFSLKEVIEKRISASLSIEKDAWEMVANEKDENIPFRNKSLLNYIVTYTKQKPRDIIKYLKICQVVCQGNTLNHETLTVAEQTYSAWFYREIRDEIQAHLPVWKEAFECISRVGMRITKIDALKMELNKHNKINSWMEKNKVDEEYILNILYDFSVIGNRSTRGVWSYAYREPDIHLNTEQNIVIHPALHEKLRLFRDDRKITKKNKPFKGKSAGLSEI